ncbi:MAG: hypothetical protein WCK00_04135 [Deltaproteobacteria bacterium]
MTKNTQHSVQRLFHLFVVGDIVNGGMNGRQSIVYNGCSLGFAIEDCSIEFEILFQPVAGLFR